MHVHSTRPSEERVRKGAEKLTKYLNSKQQGRLDGFFTVKPKEKKSPDAKGKHALKKGTKRKVGFVLASDFHSFVVFVCRETINLKPAEVKRPRPLAKNKIYVLQSLHYVFGRHVSVLTVTTKFNLWEWAIPVVVVACLYMLHKHGPRPKSDLICAARFPATTPMWWENPRHTTCFIPWGHTFFERKPPKKLT